MKMLKIDMDIKPTKEWLEEWLKSRIHIISLQGYTVEKTRKFETRRGYHIYITLYNDLPDELINKLQFLCGDDHTRVKINQWRIKRKVKRWNKLFHRVLYRRKAKALTCYYCGNKIPVPDKWFENNGKAKN